MQLSITVLFFQVGSTGIEAAWAGGERGREVTDKFLPAVPQLLSSNGLFYLVTIAENEPGEFRIVPTMVCTTGKIADSSLIFILPSDEIIGFLGKYGLRGDTHTSTRAGKERLSVLRFHRS